MEKILNLTQHTATSDQLSVGVVEPSSRLKQAIKEELTFEEIPDQQELEMRTQNLIAILEDFIAEAWPSPEGMPFPIKVMVGGAPYFMAPLERELLLNGFQPVYAFSRREAIEEVQLDGSVKKTLVFKHLGFVEVSYS